MKSAVFPGLAVAVAALLAADVVGLAVVSNSTEAGLDRVARLTGAAGPARLEVAGDTEITIPVESGQIKWSAFPNDTASIQRHQQSGVVAVEPPRLPDGAGLDRLLEQLQNPAPGAPPVLRPPPLPGPILRVPTIPDPQPYTPPADGRPATVGLVLRGSGARSSSGIHALAGTLSHAPGTIGLYEHSSPFSLYADAPEELGRGFGTGAWVDGRPADGPQAFLLLRPDLVPRLLRSAEHVREAGAGAYEFNLQNGQGTGRVETDERGRASLVTVTAEGAWGDGLVWRTTSSARFAYGEGPRVPEVEVIADSIETSDPKGRKGAFLLPPHAPLLLSLERP